MKKTAKQIILILPFILLIVIFLISLVNGIVQSLGIIPAFGLTKPTLKYYIEVLNNKELLLSIGYSLWIALVSSIIASILGTLLSYLIVSLKLSNSKFLLLVKLPIIITHLVVAVFVINIFSQTGLLSRLLYALGFISSHENFPIMLFDKVGIGVILAYLWKEIPFICYFVMTIMSKVSISLEEAAMTLGANKWKSFTSITLPLCFPTIKNGFLIILAFSFGAYELPFLLGATLPKALPVMAYIEYTHPDLLHRPYAMVLNVIMIALCVLICISYFRYLNNVEEQNERE